jgi:hypothetical protein
MHFGYLEFSWALECSGEHSTNISVFYIPSPRSVMFNGTLNVPLSFLQTFSTCHVVSKNHSKRILSTTRSIEVSMPSRALHKWWNFLQTSQKLLLWIAYQKTNERQDPYSRMPSWAPPSSRMFLGVQERNWCAINLAIDLSKMVH